MSVSSVVGQALAGAYNGLVSGAEAVSFVARGPSDGPVGPEFGKASPIGLFILVVLGVAVISLGWAFYRRFSRFRRRVMFAEAYGIDVFDEEALDKAMAEAGVLDTRRKSWL